MKYSVIVPVYNAELYLKECVDSVLNQTYSDFELILVNDGSLDASKQICDQYAVADNRVCVLHKENAGVSSARNFGLEHSLGEWIVFLDADDILHPHMLKCIDGYTLKNKDVDLIQSSYDRNKFVSDEVESKGDLIVGLSGEEYCRTGKYNVTVWASAIKADVVKKNKLRFDSRLKLAEDQVFMFQVMIHSNLCMKIPNVLYFYRDNLQSATHTSKVETVVQTLRYLSEYKKELPLATMQFDYVTMSYLYDMTLDSSCPEAVICDLFDNIKISDVSKCALRVRILYYLLLISKTMTISGVRKLKFMLGK